GALALHRSAREAAPRAPRRRPARRRVQPCGRRDRRSRRRAARAAPRRPRRQLPRDGDRVKTLVTGGAGFIGSNLVRGLLERGDDVRVLDNFSTGNRANLAGLDVEIVEGELRSYERVHNAVRGREVVYHLGALGSVPRSVQSPFSQYAAMVPLFITAIAAGEQVTIFGDGEQSRDFTYVANVVDATMRAADAQGANGRIFNVAAGSPASVNDVAAAIGRIVGKPVEQTYAPPRP